MPHKIHVRPGQNVKNFMTLFRNTASTSQPTQTDTFYNLIRTSSLQQIFTLKRSPYFIRISYQQLAIMGSSLSNFSANSYLNEHACSGRNLTWQYIHQGHLPLLEHHNYNQHSFPNMTLYNYSACPDATRILRAHGCWDGSCQPNRWDEEFNRYGWDDWHGLGNPYVRLHEEKGAGNEDLWWRNIPRQNHLNIISTYISGGRLYSFLVGIDKSRLSKKPREGLGSGTEIKDFKLKISNANSDGDKNPGKKANTRLKIRNLSDMTWHKSLQNEEIEAQSWGNQNDGLTHHRPSTTSRPPNFGINSADHKILRYSTRKVSDFVVVDLFPPLQSMTDMKKFRSKKTRL
ncbi:BgTH12-02866 [Blumeria graminis f. sp. triticale]|uniref:BgTH12-02866 n=1 Tax=Blumeria graminis f. sp. triticale TaxID=1689686 RepID=A0A9W4GFV3_BLUGR|nr:BgTH12-02866 [Blumeria graminis f. sp. triticale]